MDTVKIGEFLAQLRREQNWTQEQLGEQLGVTNKTVSRWENGNYLPPVEMLQALSQLYGVSINELLSGERLGEQEYKEKAEENIKSALEGSFTLEEKIGFYKKKWMKEHWASSVIAVVISVVLLMLGSQQNSHGLNLLAWFFLCGFILVRHNIMMAYVERRAYDPPIGEDSDTVQEPGSLFRKRLRITALILLAVGIWITADLAANYFSALVPELNDGLTVRGMWSALFFGIDGYRWSLANFYKGFATALKVTGGLGIVNILLACEDMERKKGNGRD